LTTVHVTGTGVISAMGNSWPEHWYAFQHEQTGIGRLTLFDSIHQGVLPVGEVKLSNRELCERLEQPTSSSRTILLGIHAAREALQQSSIDRLSHYRVGFISATTVGGMDRTENFFPLFLHDLKGGRLREVVDHACGKSTERIAEALGIKGFLSTVNTACSSSVNSIILGARLIRNNMLDIVVAGGTDALTQFTLNGFNSLMILDKEPCRPFDASRNGLNLGEGAGYVVLVKDSSLWPLCPDMATRMMHIIRPPHHLKDEVHTQR
jgi:3-oxoacyl-(acyl-carrier-protein) synthase